MQAGQSHNNFGKQQSGFGIHSNKDVLAAHAQLPTFKDSFNPNSAATRDDMIDDFDENHSKQMEDTLWHMADTNDLDLMEWLGKQDDLATIMNLLALPKSLETPPQYYEDITKPTKFSYYF